MIKEITWENIQPVFQELLDREIADGLALEQWLRDRSVFDAFLQEDYAWRYIHMTRDTESPVYQEAFQFYTNEIEPKILPFNNKLDKKLHESPFLSELDEDKYRIYLRKVLNSIELFRAENIPLNTEIQDLQQRYQALIGAQMVNIDGQDMTLAQAAVFLEDTDRAKREAVWNTIAKRRLADKIELNALFDSLKSLRHQLGRNTNFDNYRDYMFRSLGRFDYSVQDCEDFHEAIAVHVVPLLQQQAEERQLALGLPVLKPYDMEVDVSGQPALKPFQSGEELIDKTITCFSRLDPYIGECIATMKAQNLFDVESRKGKAPGGYNFPLAASGKPFIFMNAAGVFSDLTTMVHEGGHALHTFISDHLELTEFKDVPSEVAELASMSMELISMDHWDVFFDDPEALKRAKKEQLHDVLKTLPWVATIDAFQHWIYLHPEHDVSEREEAWNEIYSRFGAGFCDWTGLEEAKANLWQKQLHLYEVPFYYIEYGMAQLGAIAIWKNFKENPEPALNAYLDALKLGYTRTIPEIYETAGIRFDFSAEYVSELVGFVKAEIAKL